MSSILGTFCESLSLNKPVLIAGPTASGKSALALFVARAQSRTVVNADALQVFSGWPTLTAQPNSRDRAQAPHQLYGHRAVDSDYSVGEWLRDVAPLLTRRPAPVIVGGTGLYLSALTEGLVEIPSIAPETRAQATDRLRRLGLAALVNDLDPQTRAKIDILNPMRVQRAWEVLHQTGRGLASWQVDTGPPLVAPDQAHLFQILAPPEILGPRIDTRFDAMLDQGVLDEARAILPHWDPGALSSKAIGAADLVAALAGEISLDEVAQRVRTATRQYAKRQRTWFKRRMRSWITLNVNEICGDSGQHILKSP